MVFDTVVQYCMDPTLLKGEGLAIDASLVRVNVARQHAEESPVNWTPAKTTSHAVTEYLITLDKNPALRRTQEKVSVTDLKETCEYAMTVCESEIEASSSYCRNTSA